MDYSGGYLLLSTASTDQSAFKEQLKNGGFQVDKLISMDEEVGGVFPNLFDIWKNQKPKRSIPVLSEQVLNKVMVSMVFGTLVNAREAFQEVKSLDSTVSLIGISLNEKYLEKFHDYRNHLNDKNGEGVVLCLAQKEAPSKGGTFAGYDVAGYETGGRFLSYLGNHLLANYQDIVSEMPINQFGLFSDLKTAQLLAHHTNEILIDAIEAEDVLWLPWKIKIYEGA